MRSVFWHFMLVLGKVCCPGRELRIVIIFKFFFLRNFVLCELFSYLPNILFSFCVCRVNLSSLKKILLTTINKQQKINSKSSRVKFRM